eukprot:RCo000391
MEGVGRKLSSTPLLLCISIDISVDIFCTDVSFLPASRCFSWFSFSLKSVLHLWATLAGATFRCVCVCELFTIICITFSICFSSTTPEGACRPLCEVEPLAGAASHALLLLTDPPAPTHLLQNKLWHSCTL